MQSGRKFKPCTLEVNGNYSRQEWVALPIDVAGSYHVFVVTDADSQVYEATGEPNNQVDRSLLITGKNTDLQVTAVHTLETEQTPQVRREQLGACQKGNVSPS
ncbi:MAG: hypothetical protein HC769_26275 [Cyanobacteria bacterium CRU_2_1]|nr:hypothetical protein [Cyanobacteria bacterium CRU_2_1]